MSNDTKDIEDELDFNNFKMPTDKEVSSSANEEQLIDARNHLYECTSCGYVYDPSDGVKKYEIARGTPFLELDQVNFRCPVCRLSVDVFRDIGLKSKPSGFDENLNYGLGINNLTPGQKNVLIFGGMAFAVACFLSLYSLH